MQDQLSVSIGQHSDKGRKETNQDFHGVCCPNDPLLTSKGIAIALADGISSSDVSHMASEAAVTGLLEDYYCTSEAWSVRKSTQRVLMATNSWLHSQTRQSQHRYVKDKGYVCTLSAMVLKSATAYIFHVGDSRIYRLRNHELEQLTEDHRVWLSQYENYLSRAMGMDSHIEIDYKTLEVETGDIFVFMTDGVYEYCSNDVVTDTIEKLHYDLDLAARTIIDTAYRQGSKDNLTTQIIRVDNLPEHSAGQLSHQIPELPFPPELKARMEFDGYTIVREIRISSRSHIYLAVDLETSSQVIIKTPSIDLCDDPAYLERFMMEEWIARRIDSPYVLKPCPHERKRNYLYIVTEFVDGQTLSQWMRDNPKPDLEAVRGIIEQIASGLRAFHRLEMLHQDIRPENIMIDATGTVRIIDFGSTRVAGILEMSDIAEDNNLLGTVQYAAPEYFLGENGTSCSDLFSLGIICYQMLTGRLPYGAKVARSRSRSSQKKLKYQTALDESREIPVWIDAVLKKAVHPNPNRRYQELSEFVYDLRHPGQLLMNRTITPLAERNPVLFWKSISLIFAIIIMILLIQLAITQV